jgi:hypothetical protein
MTPQFLRSEAARFREMADAADREPSRQRLLAMAADYEARADAAVAAQPISPMQATEPEQAPAPETTVEVAEVTRKSPTDRRLRLTRTSSASSKLDT